MLKLSCKNCKWGSFKLLFCRGCHGLVHTTIISWTRRDESSLKSFDVQIYLLSRATGSVSSGDVSGLTSMVAKRAKLRATILLPLETRKVARGNTEIWTSKLFNELSSRLTQLIIVVSACRTCRTLILPRSTNQILNLWRCRFRSRHWC